LWLEARLGQLESVPWLPEAGLKPVKQKRKKRHFSSFRAIFSLLRMLLRLPMVEHKKKKAPKLEKCEKWRFLRFCFPGFKPASSSFKQLQTAASDISSTSDMLQASSHFK
jgi:hypothetical protein